MRYTDLIFDLYGTLVDIHTEENDAMWEKTALFFCYHGAHYTGPTLRRDFYKILTKEQSIERYGPSKYPDFPYDQVMSRLFLNRGVTWQTRILGFQATEILRILSTDYIRLYPYVTEALSDLKKAGCRLWLLTNAQRTSTICELRHLGLLHTFKGTYISSDHCCRKPDSRFFRALLDEQKLCPQQCLMIGNDRETDIDGAKALGLDTLFLHTRQTPSHQAAADPALAPGKAAATTHHYEFEGADWAALTPHLLALCRGEEE